MTKIVKLITLFILSILALNPFLDVKAISVEYVEDISSISTNNSGIVYETRGVKTRIAKYAFKKFAKFIRTERKGKFESFLIKYGIEGDDVAKVVSKRNQIADKFDDIADKLDETSSITSGWIIEYTAPFLGTELATMFARALMLFLL